MVLRTSKISVLAPTLVPRILRYLLTSFNEDRFIDCAPESSFRYEFHFAFFGLVFIRLFFF